MNDKKSILEMARGAIMERVNYDMAAIIENILDPNTKATAKRKLTLTLEFTPDDKRETIMVSATSKQGLAPANSLLTSLYVGKENDEVVAVEMTPQIPGQNNFFGDTQEQPPQLELMKKAN